MALFIRFRLVRSRMYKRVRVFGSSSVSFRICDGRLAAVTVHVYTWEFEKPDRIVYVDGTSLGKISANYNTPYWYCESVYYMLIYPSKYVYFSGLYDDFYECVTREILLKLKTSWKTNSWIVDVLCPYCELTYRYK